MVVKRRKIMMVKVSNRMDDEEGGVPFDSMNDMKDGMRRLGRERKRGSGRGGSFGAVGNGAR